MPPISIQFDPFSFAVALIAVVISALAYRASRRAPLEARHQEQRDEVRGALKDALRQIPVPLETLDRGGKLGPVPSDFAYARNVVAEVAPRLPENRRLENLSHSLGAVAHFWAEANRAAKLVDSAQVVTDQAHARVMNLAGQSSREVAQGYRDELAEARSRLETLKRQSETQRNRLAKVLMRCRIMAKAYVDEVDAKSRGPQRKWLWRRKKTAG